MDDAELIQEFLTEATEHLQVLEEELLAIEEELPTGVNTERLHRIFRSVHSIKGTAGFLGFQNIIALSHAMETLFDRFRKGEATPTPHHLTVLLEGGDTLRALIENLAEEASRDISSQLHAVEALLAETSSTQNQKPATHTPPTGSPAAPEPHSPPENLYHLAIDDLDAFERLLDITPVRLFKLLEKFGTVTGSVRAPAAPRSSNAALPIQISFHSPLSPAELEKATGIPDFYFEPTGTAPASASTHQSPHSSAPAATAQTPSTAPAAPAQATTGFLITFTPGPETLASPGALEGLWKDLASLGTLSISPDPATAPPASTFSITLLTSHTPAQVRDAFLFVENGSQITIQPLPATAPPAPLSSSPAPSPEGTPAPSPPSANPMPAPANPSAKTPDTPAPANTPSPRDTDLTPAASKQTPAPPAAADTLRVSSDKLDRLVNLVGEMVILQSQLLATSKAAADQFPELLKTVESMERLSGELRDIVLNIRMMPVGATFSKYQRLVRDLSKQLGKEARLEIEGGDTELDKTVLDQLGDPLVHILRNSLDHGLEPPHDRTAAGKPPCGTIRLAAQHCGERVIITIEDDGRGLNTERIRAKALERGLISPDARLTEQEIWQLIFAPGFSTAQQVTGISGRGVGMDVVKKKIELLGGEVKLDSRPGHGTTLRLSLPLTLAIIDGLMVEVDSDRLIIPLSLVSETIELTRAERLAHNRRNIVELRGHPIPYLRLREIFGFPEHDAPLESVVILQIEGGTLGIVVDRVVSIYQTVLKSLGRLCRDITLFSGATILGDGTVALVLDINGLLRLHRDSLPDDLTLAI